MDAERIRVLLVDDDQGDFEMTRAMIAEIADRAIELDWASSYEEGVHAFEEGEHDVYIVDYKLEDRSGIDLLHEARRRSTEAPVIMLTGRGSRDVDMEAMRAGAADYLDKGRLDPELLERSIRFALQRSRAERALRESEARGRGMFEHLPIGLYRTSPDGEFLDANPALVRILGYPDDETLRETYAPRLYVNDDDRDRLWELLECHGAVRGFESWIRRADRREARVRTTARLHRNPDGSVAYVEGSVEDVTEAGREQRAPIDRERFRCVFEEVPVGIALVELDGEIMLANPAFGRIFGWDPADAQGRSYPDLVEEGRRAELLEKFRAVARGEREQETAERSWIAADGGAVRARSKTRLIRNRRGEPNHVLVLFEDGRMTD